MPGKLFIGFVVVNMLFTNCGSSGGSRNMGREELQEVCKAFVKTICTKDTAAFYDLVDKSYLTTSMNEWVGDGKKVTQDDLFFPFFFVYGPLKIRYEDLISERNKKDFFSDFEIENKEMTDDLNVKLSITWTQNFAAAKTQKIDLHLRKKDVWKIAGAKWKTL